MSDNYNQDYDQNFARQAGYAAGAVEGEYNRADQAAEREEQNIGNEFRSGVQDVENAPENAARAVEKGYNETIRDVENVPSDIGSGIKQAANWIGEKLGGVERKEQETEQDLNNFGEGVENSYSQGEQEGEREGGRRGW